jgi:hypothetical protein
VRTAAPREAAERALNAARTRARIVAASAWLYPADRPVRGSEPAPGAVGAGVADTTDERDTVSAIATPATTPVRRREGTGRG